MKGNVVSSDCETDSDDGEIPKECPICEEEFKDPVVT